VWALVKETFAEWRAHRAPRLGAALAYYTVFALAPLLVIVIAIAGLAFGEAAAQGRIVEQIQGIVGPDGARTIQTMLASARQPASGIIATAISLVVLVLGACGLVAELKDSLNTIWGVTARSGRGPMGIVIDYVMSLAMVLGIGFLLMVSLVLSAGLAAIAGFFADMLPGSVYTAHALQALNFLFSFGVIALLFASIFKFLPDADVAWRDVWIGGVVTSLLFTIGQHLVGLYLGKRSVGSPYGAAGSLVVVLVWVYYSAQILFLGAEFTQVYARRYGARRGTPTVAPPRTHRPASIR
jgi:membrane protein